MTLWSYVKLMRAGRKWQGIQGNSAQLGGDFVVDREGILRFVYRSADPTDRPAVEQLVAALQEIEDREPGT